MADKPISRYYPTIQQLKDPQSTHAVVKQVLDQHYSLADRLAALEAKLAASATQETK